MLTHPNWPIVQYSLVQSYKNKFQCIFIFFCFFFQISVLTITQAYRETLPVPTYICLLLNFDFLGGHQPVRSDAKHRFPNVLFLADHILCKCELSSWVAHYLLGTQLSRAICASALKEMILSAYIYQTSRLLNLHRIHVSHASSFGSRCH